MPRSAELSGGRWTLSDVLVYYRDNLQPSQLDTLVYSGAMKPAQAGARSGAPEDMSLAELSYFIENQGFGIRPVWVYETWAHKRVSLFFSGLLMMALCIPLATRFRRGGGLGVPVRGGRRHGLSLFHRRRHLAHHGRTGLRLAMACGMVPARRLRLARRRADAQSRDGLTPWQPHRGRPPQAGRADRQSRRAGKGSGKGLAPGAQASRASRGRHRSASLERFEQLERIPARAWRHGGREPTSSSVRATARSRKSSR